MDWIKQIDKLIDKNKYHGMDIALREALKEAKIIENIKKRANTNIKKSKKLHIGSGKNYLKDFINIDCISKKADMFYDIREGFPFNKEEINLVFSEHTLEHIDYPISVKLFFKESYRVLKKGGKLIIGVPDTKKILKGYINNNQKLFQEYKNKRYKKRKINPIKNYIDLVNLHFRDEINSEIYTRHLWSFDFNNLKSLSQEHGFLKCRRIKFPSQIGNPKRKFGSIYIECIK